MLSQKGCGEDVGGVGVVVGVIMIIIVHLYSTQIHYLLEALHKTKKANTS